MRIVAPQFCASVMACFLAGTPFVACAQSSHGPANGHDSQQPMNYDGAAGGVRLLEEGQPLVMVHPTVEAMQQARAAHAAFQQSSTNSNLYYHGGTGGIGVETTPKIYLVFWGSQWNNNDPSQEASILENFFTGVGGSSWQATVTQYCQGIASGSSSCGTTQLAGNQMGSFVNYWYDNAGPAPSHPRQSQIANEAIRAAQHFSNTGAGSNASVQYVIATATRNNSSGFGTSYCAWHSSTSSSYGNIAYTNLPYMTDAGASCGANFNNLGATAGITIVEGHEMGETITDQFPSTGWLDGSGSEIGDKCAWISSGQGAAAMVSFPDGTSFPVQSLWSNAFNSGAGGCVVSYP